MLRSSKNADQRKQWWYRVAGYSAVENEYWLHLDEFHLELLILPAIKRVESSLIVVRKSARQTRRQQHRPGFIRAIYAGLRHMFHLYKVHVK